jgi:hypothetical protein
LGRFLQQFLYGKVSTASEKKKESHLKEKMPTKKKEAHSLGASDDGQEISKAAGAFLRWPPGHMPEHSPLSFLFFEPSAPDPLT